MLTVAYLANQFPSSVEPYVGDEIAELRRRGVRVIAGSVRRAQAGSGQPAAELVVQEWRIGVLLRAVWLCVRGCNRIADLVVRVIWRGGESAASRLKALLHTWLGACYAVMLANENVDHIHIHHGYFASWVGMIAARLLGVPFSMTLHGSDLLLRGAYLDVKLANCLFCMTVSEYNRRYILENYRADPKKVVVSRLGVEVTERASFAPTSVGGKKLNLLAVGRLHKVKDHAFLVHGCAQLEALGLQFACSIAGEGPERRRLESLIRKLGLERRVTLLGHVSRGHTDSLYRQADVVVLTSRSEGLPLVLMEAMVRGKIVLAPAITGIPELVIPGKTGFLYEGGSRHDFVDRLLFIYSLVVHSRVQTNRNGGPSSAADPHGRYPAILHPATRWARRKLDWVRHAARVQVHHNFNRDKNLGSFGDIFLQRITPQPESAAHENFVLQQVQLSVQRHRSVPV
jgi:colanic acid/amylovoran biosynthesis glycosyltransferase